MSDTVFVQALNGSYIDIDSCSLKTCSLDYAETSYRPSKAINLAYLIIFALVLLAQIIQGPIYRAAGFSIGMCLGLVLEVIGYAGRLGLHSDPFSFDYFVM